MNEIAQGVLIGLFGPTLTRWLGRYKYRSLFIATVLIFYVLAFGAVILGGYGVGDAFRVFVERTLTTSGILAPIGIGCIVVFCTFVASMGQEKK